MGVAGNSGVDVTFSSFPPPPWLLLLLVFCFLVPCSEENCQGIVLLITGHSTTFSVPRITSEPMLCLHEGQQWAAG